MSRPSEITRDRILKTAVRLFAERGYEATSVRTLAAKAHVNQAAINYHFKTKDGYTDKYCAMPFKRLRKISSPMPRKRRQCRVSAR
jgi:AcrR family transcriptional regulator